VEAQVLYRTRPAFYKNFWLLGGFPFAFVGPNLHRAAGPHSSFTILNKNMKKQLLTLALLLSTAFSHAQSDNVGLGIVTPDASAKLDVTSTTQGMLMPRMTSAQRAAIASPALGLVVYQTDVIMGLYYYDGVFWRNLSNDQLVDASGQIIPPGTVTTFAGSGTSGSTDATGTAASFSFPSGVAIDAGGNVYVADVVNQKIRKITPAGVVTTFAGSGASGSTDATGTAASFGDPYGIAVDASGNVYVADQSNHKIRKITSAGVVTTFAGSGSQGSTDGTGTAASFNYPLGVAVDAVGNVYVADRGNNKIRKITPAGTVTTLAGNGVQGSTDATGTAASFYYPYGVAVDAGGNVYVADQSNHKIRKITPAGVVTTLAGSGSQGSTDAMGTAASFIYPLGVAVDAGGNVYVADGGNHKIRKITPTGTVTTFAGSGSIGSTDGTGTAASFYYPTGVAIGTGGNMYVADRYNHKIRKANTR
jgi:sugar lactone lactonase YvrE